MWKRWWGDAERGPRTREDPGEAGPVRPPAGKERLLSPEDEELLDRISRATVRRGLGVPAIFLLESSKPLNFLGSQFLHFLSPMVHSVFDAKDLDRFAVLLERRETVEELIRRIEQAESRA